MEPKIGMIVLYYPTLEEQKTKNNHQTVCPAIVTAVWSSYCVNLKILFDGVETGWNTSVCRIDNANKEMKWDFVPTPVFVSANDNFNNVITVVGTADPITGTFKLKQ